MGYSPRMPGDHFYAKLSNSLGARGLRWAGRLNVPLYRLSGGRIGSKVGDGPVLLLTTTGRKSGEQRTAPLIYGRDGDAYVIVASKGGAPQHPAWYLNLDAEPQVELQVKDEVFAARARTASGDERGRLWQQMAGIWPAYDDYAKKTDREIPVVVLERA
jgi:deazaflavin-dependent oxidoreductase (nitroreductase family)